MVHVNESRNSFLASISLVIPGYEVYMNYEAHIELGLQIMD